MQRPPFLSRPSIRSRRSLHETSTPSMMHSARRLERHSIGGGSTGAISAFNSLHVSLLEHMQVQFVKAFVPANKLSRPRYVMKVTNVALGRSWEMVRLFKEFWELREALLRALDHGHLCKSNCPWIFMFVTHHFPRRHFFRSRQASVVSERLTELQSFITTLLKAMKEDRDLDCCISAQALPKIMYTFLYEGMVFDRADFANTVLESRVSLSGDAAAAAAASCDDRKSMCGPEDTCTICDLPLKPCDKVSITIAPSVSRSSDPTSDSSTCSSSEASDGKTNDNNLSVAVDPQMMMMRHVSLTTLECGHRFHDECILEKLNVSLVCPLCVADQANGA